jgi:hypothetical protein
VPPIELLVLNVIGVGKAVPEQMVWLAPPVMMAIGATFTVTVIVVDAPAQEPNVAVGVTLYCTVPAVELLGLERVWLIVDPLPALAPVMPPVTAPIVQAKVPGTLDVSIILGPLPLQAAAVIALVTTGAGLAVIVI